MIRYVTAIVTVVLCSAPAAWAETGVRVESVFVRAYTTSEITQAEVNQSVQLIVSVKDISTSPLGVAIGYIDVAWDPNILQLVDPIDGSNSTTNDVSPLFKNPWTDFFKGTKNSDGVVMDLGAGQGLVPPVFNFGNTVSFFTLTFTTKAKGNPAVTLTPHDFGVIVTEQPGSVQNYQTINPTLTVVGSGGSVEPTPGPACPSSAAPFLAAFLAGWVGVLGSRRPRR